MTTTIDNNQRVFAVYRDDKPTPVFCNLHDLQSVCNTVAEHLIVIRHVWNGKIQRISKKDVIAMLKSQNLNHKFYPFT